MAENWWSEFGLKDKTAIITGAASGIGRATAELFTDAGARVVIADLDGDAAVAAANEIGRGTTGLQCDVSDEQSVLDCFGRADTVLGGKLDILVNNAAYRGKSATLSMTVAEWDIMHAVIARGTFLCLRQAVLRMQKQGGGAIINLSSVSARQPTILQSVHYDSAKAGVDAMTRATAIEFAPDNIRINSVQPGGTATGGVQKMQEQIKLSGPIFGAGRIILGRVAQPIEQARAILFLASDAASYITGHHLTVDGGYAVS